MATPKIVNRRTPIEDEMARHLREHDITDFHRNARFVAGRRFEADFWFPDLKLALEVDGGVFLPRGGHTSGVGYTSDRERDIEATLQGILTVRYTSEQVRSGYAITTFQAIHAARGGHGFRLVAATHDP